MTEKPTALRLAEKLATWMLEIEAQRDELLEALRGYVNDYSSEDGMYTEKHYVKVFSEAIARAEGKQ